MWDELLSVSAAGEYAGTARVEVGAAESSQRQRQRTAAEAAATQLTVLTS